MILAKNYETVSKFVKVMPRILCVTSVFFPDTVYIILCHVWMCTVWLAVCWRVTGRAMRTSWLRCRYHTPSLICGAWSMSTSVARSSC